MQNGSVLQRTRKMHSDIWQFRWREKTADGKRIYPHRIRGYRNGRGVTLNRNWITQNRPRLRSILKGSTHLANSEVHRGVQRVGKSKKIIGSSGRTRTYNPSVNSRMLCH